MGVDRVERLIGMNRAQHTLGNLSFHAWDYREPKPAKVQSANVLLCGLGINNLDDGGYDQADGHSPRGTAGYQRHKHDAAVYFRNWRSAARDNAALFAVLRICTFGRFLAFLDAAQESGWTAQLDQCVNIPIPTAREQLPALAFRAAPSEPVAEDEALAHFVRLCTVGNPYLQAVGPLALALYQSLGNRQVLFSHTCNGTPGISTFEEVGTAGATGYVFARDSRPQYQLSVISVVEAEAINGRLRWQADERRRQAENPIEGAFVVGSQSMRGLQLVTA